MRGGFRPLNRAAGLVDEGIVHELSGVQEFQRFDSRCDDIARWAFSVLRRVFASSPAALATIDDQERAYWAAAAAADRSFETHAEEGVALLQKVSALLLRGAA
jgi:hypothetical protein